MRAGRLRHRVTVQRATESRDVMGGVTQTWATLFQAWAGVEPLSGNEVLRAGGPQAVGSVRVVLRWRSDYSPTPKDRILHGSRALDVVHIANRDERNREWEFLCSEAVT